MRSAAFSISWNGTSSTTFGMEHGPSDAGERGEGKRVGRKAKSKAKESYKVSTNP